MIVISDTSPLTALLTIGTADILTKLFREVVIPEAVRNEHKTRSQFGYSIKNSATPIWGEL
jgi:predicted nucleic acid-binding protein